LREAVGLPSSVESPAEEGQPAHAPSKRP
jgi:hypothetical protein